MWRMHPASFEGLDCGAPLTPGLGESDDIDEYCWFIGVWELQSLVDMD